MSILDVLRQNQQFYSDLDQGVVSGNRLPLLPNEDVMYGSVIPNIDYSVSPQDEDEDEENLDISRFENMDLQPGYLDRAGSFGTNYNFNQPNFFQRMFNKTSDIFGSGIESLMNVYSKLPTPINLIRGFAERFGEPSRYSRFSPGGTFRGGIFNIGGVNTPIQLVNDFYDRTTGLNRFDRARNRFNQTRSLKDLFGASRTLAEFNNARKIAAAQKASGYTSNFMDRPASERNYTGPSGGDNTGGDVGARGAADSFSNRSGMGRTGY